MKKLILVLGFILSILALILAFTPLFSIAVIPAVIALLIGFIVLFLYKGSENNPKKPTVYIFLIALIALAFSTYKILFITAELGNVEDLELKEKTSEDNAKELLEGLEIEE